MPPTPPVTPLASSSLAAWSVRHPIGVVMLTLAVMVLGGFALGRLNVDLLPHVIYPEVRVRIVNPGVPAKIMEDAVTRQLEEQLAITEGAIAVQSETQEGRSSVDLSFAYGTDIDLALRDASSRLDRAKRFLPDEIDPPTIYKRDPFQIPIAEYVIGSPLLDATELRAWVDYGLSRALLNLPGVAAAEVGGGLEREVQVIADQHRLAGLGLDVLDLERALRAGNLDVPAGRLRMTGGEISGRTSGRFEAVAEIADLPLRPGLALGEAARVIDGSAEERLRIRVNDQPGIKLSIQKQPQANTVAVVDAVNARLAQLRERGEIPSEVQVEQVSDQARYIRQSLHNAVAAAVSGALLAMLVVYLFLGSLRRTLIIGSAIPIAVLVTFILMSMAGLNFNIMTLGGLALGVGMLVDNTIVVLENVYRHQRLGEAPDLAAATGATEVSSAVVAATSTNLAAVLPFLFIGGLVGLLFRELIFTISAAILASLAVSLTLVPALAGRVPAGREGLGRRAVNRVLEWLQNGYARGLGVLLRVRWLVIAAFAAALVYTVPMLDTARQEFLPKMDDGQVQISLTADSGIDLEAMDAQTRRIEDLLGQQPEVQSLFSTVGGFVFGRTQREDTNRASIKIQLAPLAQRGITVDAWIQGMRKQIAALQIPGLKVILTQPGIRGIRINRGSEDLSIRIKGPDLDTLASLADQALERLAGVEGLTNLQHSAQDLTQELSIQVDRERAASFGLGVEDVGAALRFALDGKIVTDFIQDDRSIDVRLRLDRLDVAAPGDLESIVLFSKGPERKPLHLGDLARVEILPQPGSIKRDAQARIVEITAGIAEGTPQAAAIGAALAAVADLKLPIGYTLYEGGSLESLQEGRDLGKLLLGLALFLVLVVMAVQYESLRNPIIIMLSVPFALTGVVLGLQWAELPVSMPVWLGLIMLAGIVVNNAIVLVEFIEIQRAAGLDRDAAILEAARLRLRPILMTTLTTVVGMLPLALAWGEGAEMLQPLAVTMVAGLSYSTLVSLVLVPMVYRLLGARAVAGDGTAGALPDATSG